MKKYVLSIIVFSSILSNQLSAITNYGVRAQSMGGAYRALASSNNTIFYNPAGLVKLRRLAADIDYQFKSKDKSFRLGTSVVDAKTTAWGMGLAYIADIDSAGTRPVGHQAFLSMALPIVSDLFCLGGSLSYNHRLNSDFFNFDAGFLLNMPVGLSIALVLDHLIAPKSEPLSFALAGAFSLGVIPLSIAVDWVMDDFKSDDDLKHVLAAGLEYKALPILPLRLGIQSVFYTHEQSLSLGTGLLMGLLDIDALYQQNLRVGKDRQFGLSLRMAF